MKLNIGTCQFPTTSDIKANLDFVLRLMRYASGAEGDVAHFPEACLSGYAGSDIDTNADIDWGRLASALTEVLALAASLRIWVVLGSAHRLTPPHKPHNSLYVISDEGRIIDRYDKRFLSGDPSQTTGDLAHYSPGNSFQRFRHQRCALRGFDLRRVPLSRTVSRLQATWRSGHVSFVSRCPCRRREMGEDRGRDRRGKPCPQPRHHISGHNPTGDDARCRRQQSYVDQLPDSAAYRSCWPSFFVRPDGVISGRLGLHEAGVLLSTVDTEVHFYDSTVAWRERAMSGTLHSGSLVADPRSDDRTAI